MGFPGTPEIVHISAYFQFRHPTGVYVHKLENILNNTCIMGSRILIGADVNAFSTNWHSRMTDRRGRLVEKVIEREGLLIYNEQENLPTYSGPRGSTNIDMTFSKGLEWIVSEWKDVGGHTDSDHNIITYIINCEGTGTVGRKLTRRFNTRKANWRKFQLALAYDMMKYEEYWTLEEQAEALTKYLYSQCS